MGTTKRGTKSRKRRIVKHTNLKRVAIALLLALIGLGVFTLAYGYSYQAKTKLRLQDTIKALQVKDKLLDSKSKEAQDNAKKIEELTKQLQAKKEAATALAEAQRVQTPAVTHVEAPRTVSSSHTELMTAAGIPSSQWSCTEFIISHESGWRVNATNPSSGAYGLPQSLPGSKMATAGADWRTNPVTQLRWFYSYVNARYGSPCGAYNFWQSHHWY